MKLRTNLLSVDTNAKTVKGIKKGYHTAILYLAPHKISGKNLCAFASKGCAESCLYSAGRGKFNNVQQARINKSRLFIEQRDYFMNSLVEQINKLERKYGNSLAIRLNGTSDIPFQNIKINRCFSPHKEFYSNIFEAFFNVTFYDYTKDFKKVINNNLPNYHLTFSLDETQASRYKAKEVLKSGNNVAVVVSQDLYKSLFKGDSETINTLVSPNNNNVIKLANGDLNDLRFLDSKQSLVILKAKGDANKDSTGFVIHSINELFELINF